MVRRDIDDKKQQIICWLENGMSRAEVAKRLKCKYDILKSRLDKWGCTIKNQSGKGNPRLGARKPAHYFLKNDGPAINTYKLKNILFRDGIKLKICEICNITEWQGRPAPLELDHIDGNKYNNSIDNLRVICSNCHSIQPTNSGKNIGSYS